MAPGFGRTGRTEKSFTEMMKTVGGTGLFVSRVLFLSN